MKVPDLFIPEKDLDKKMEDIIRDSKPRIGDLQSLACIPKNIGNYDLKGEFLIINEERWRYYFGDRIPEYLSQAAMMTYMAPHSLYVTTVHFLRFKGRYDLEKLNKYVDLEKEISMVEGITTKCVKKDNYLVAIRANKADNHSLKLIADFYLNNLEMEEL